MNYYPEQLRRIAAMCEALSGLDNLSDDAKVTFGNRIPVVDSEDDTGPALGYLVDEIGGVWSFEPAGGAE